MNITAVNELAFATHPDAAMLNDTISENPAWLGDHKTNPEQATFLAQIALNAVVNAYREEKNYAPFSLADFEHVRVLAEPFFEYVDHLMTDEPCLIWGSPWSMRADSATDYALIISFFSHETDERTVDLSMLTEEDLHNIAAILGRAAELNEPVTRDYLLSLTGMDQRDEEDQDLFHDYDVFHIQLNELLAGKTADFTISTKPKPVFNPNAAVDDSLTADDIYAKLSSLAGAAH